MNILILGDVVGVSGQKVIKRKLKETIEKYKIDFTVVNGENASDDGKGITKEITDDFFDNGVDVITSGNHIWDKSETIDFIEKEKRLLRPANFVEGSPGRGQGIFKVKNKNFKISVINLMGNVFMKKTDDVFYVAGEILKKIKLKKDADFLIVDFHGEITSEKMAMGHYLDGKITCFVGTHTHVPTADTRVLPKGTGYQTDIGMCGDYNSVIGMDKNNSLMKFLKSKDAKKHFPANGEGSLSGVIIEADEETGLTKKISRLVEGGVFKI